MAASGLRMRSMGRRESEASPTSVKQPFLRRKQAGDHAHGRAGVAAVQRIALDGVTRPPTPVTSTRAVFAPA